VAESRHKTTIEVGLDTRAAKRDAQALQRVLDDAAKTAAGMTTGGGRGGGGGGGGGGGSPGGAETSGGRPAVRSGGGGIATVAGMAGGAVMGGSPGAPLQLAGAGIAGAGMAARWGAKKLGIGEPGSVLGKLGGVGSAIGGIAGAALAFGAGGMSAMYADAQKAAAINQALGRARFYGVGGASSPTLSQGGLAGLVNKHGGDIGKALAEARSRSSGMREAAKQGFGPQEASQMMEQAGQIAGFRGSGLGPGMFGLARRGVGVGAMGQFAGAMAPGVGGIGGRSTMRDVISMAMSAEGGGLRGRRVEQILGAIASHVERMGQQGLDVNIPGIQQFVGRGLRMGGPMSGQTLRLNQVAMGLSGAFGGARQRVLSPFSGLAEHAVLGSAIGKGGGPLDVAAALEAAQGDPEIARQLMVKAFGKDAAAASMAAMGAPAGMARGLASGRFGDMQAGEFALPSAPGGIEMQRMNAEGDLARIASITAGEMKSLTETVLALRSVMTDVGKLGAKFVEAMRGLP
jgi:hypothetical protein